MSARSGQCALLLLVLSGGCATYTDAVRSVYQAADAGDYTTGLTQVNKILKVENCEQLPEKWTDQRSLAVLERAVLLQATGQYRASARDLSAAESELELLDLDPDAGGKIGKYIYSDSAEAYKTPPTERLAISALNMVNYLATDDLQGAAVEARRFTVSRNYLESLDKAAHGAFGSYLAGFVFEKLGEPERALRYYEEARSAGDLEVTHEPIARLSGRAEEGEPAPVDADGEILIVLGLGRVPYKVPKRIPVGLAVTMAAPGLAGDPEVLATLAMKMIVYPELVVRDNVAENAAVNLDGRDVPVELVTDLGNEVAREYESMKPKIIASALTRLVARAAAAEAARRLPPKAEGSTRSIAALAAEAALLLLDKPDTRSWTLLPAHMYIARARVGPGLHDLRVELRGTIPQTRFIPVDVPAAGFRVAAVIEPR